MHTLESDGQYASFFPELFVVLCIRENGNLERAVVVNFSPFLRLPVWWSDISLIPIQKRWRHITTSSSRNNVNAICSKYDVVPITLLWPLAFHYPIVGDNRTNDWLRCSVAEMDRYRGTGWMGSDDNAETVARHCAWCDCTAIYEPQLEPWRQISSASVAINMAENNVFARDLTKMQAFGKIILYCVSLFDGMWLEEIWIRSWDEETS
jgi:hypothetical protein